MRKYRTITALAAVAAGIAALAAAPTMGQEVTGKDAKPFRGPLKADLPLAKGYDEAARALAMVDDNPLIRWEYRVWCQTGYRNVEEAGSGQEIDKPVDITRDHITPKGFHIIDGSSSELMPAGGVRFMDNAWYFGANALGVVVVKTPDGLLLFDAMTTPDEFEKTVLSQMPAAGLDPKDIRYVFVGHHHADHTGGVNRILKLAPNAKIVAGAPDVDVIEEARKAVLAGTTDKLPSENHALVSRKSKPKTPEEAARLRALQLSALPERIDIRVSAQEGLKTGVTTLHVGPSTDAIAVLAPGHTVGQMHVIVPVMHNGTVHKLLVMSGNDQPIEAWQYAISTDYLRSVAAFSGADTLINTHGYQGAEFYYLRQLHANPAAANPFVMGTGGVDRYLGVFANCQRAIYHRLKDGTWLGF